ncbi:MAG TPA: Gfo/Idh/MocA family oxidoreductase [Sphingomicrobium sp.]|jgi:predicted dehydrogenase|nr:Gfo/Idh/MocA family oxidoreductase [Sphingomicrobium sp.]
MKPIRIAIIGFGKIAADQHFPSIAGNPRLELAATSSRSGAGPQPAFTDWRELIRTVKDLDAVAITTPPKPRYAIARECLEAGLHVLLEKPPAATLSEVEDLACIAEAEQRTLYATWHARHNAGVAGAAEALAGKRVETMHIRWHEDVRKWHPGQTWIWQAGGFGVFDPGVNAFSIATKIFPGALFVDKAELAFPQASETPIAAEVLFSSPEVEGPLTCSLDWRRTEGEEWTIEVKTADGLKLVLTDGGARLAVNGAAQQSDATGEYADIYRSFVDLIDRRQSEVDVRPLRLVADCLLIGSRQEVGPVPA